MAKLRVQPTNKLSGVIASVPSKSHSIRAVCFAALARGKSRLTGLLDSPDVAAAIEMCRVMGATLEPIDGGWEVAGFGGRPAATTAHIDVGNSGLTLRLGMGMAALTAGHYVFDGDESIRTRRPIAALVDGINQLGGVAHGINGYAPVVVRGPVRVGRAEVEGPHASPIHSLLTVMALLEGDSELVVRDPGTTPWIDMSLWWLKRLGVEVTHQHHRHYQVRGRGGWDGFTYAPAGDFSSAAFPLVAAAVTGSEVTVDNLDRTDPQGDHKVLDHLALMGCHICSTSSQVSLRGKEMKGIEIDVDGTIDAVPILAVAACMASGQTRIHNGSAARKKESDRIAVMARELKKMGADIQETTDGLIIRQSQLKGTHVSSHSDHRVAMALTVAGLVAKGETVIDGIECVAKTYPNFVDAMQQLGASVEYV